MAYLNLYILLFVFITLSNCEKPDDTKDHNDRRTRVQVNVPNPFNNFVPNLGKMIDNFVTSNERKPFFGDETPKSFFDDHAAKPVSPRLHQVQDNYKSLREFVQSALNLGTRGMNTNGLFSLDLKNNGPNTKLDVNTLLGRVQMNAKAPTESTVTKGPTNEEAAEGTQTSTEVPVSEYLNNLLQGQIDRISRRLGDFTLSVTDRSGNRIASVRSTTKESRGKENIPEGPVNSAMDPSGIKRSGRLPQSDEMNPMFDDFNHEDYHAQLHGNFEEDMDSAENGLPFHQGRSAGRNWENSGYYVDRPRPFSRTRDPVRKLTERYYKLSTGKSQNTEEDNQAYDDYIEDLEQVTGVLSNESKNKLKAAFRQFKSSLERIDFGDNFDISKLVDEPEDIHAWVPGRIVDQKDLEIAFLNIDKDEKPQPGDKMVLAFTLTGTPLKIYMDSKVKSPLRHLHKRLTEAGVTLNIPVKSFNNMEPIGGEVLYVGANNKGRFVTRAMSIIVPKADNIKNYVSRYSKPVEPSSHVKHEELTKALQKSVAFEGKSFSNVLAENLQKRPDQVVADIMDFLGTSQFSTTSPSDESTEASIATTD